MILAVKLVKKEKRPVFSFGWGLYQKNKKLIKGTASGIEPETSGKVVPNSHVIKGALGPNI